MGSARLLMRMAYICSNCERALKLKVADKMPDKCPYCKSEFTRESGFNERVVNDSEESLIRLKVPAPVSSNG